MLKRHAATILLGTEIAFGATEAQAVPITFSTNGIFSATGTNVASFSDGSGTTTLTFNAAMDSVFTPAGAQFGDIVVTSTEPSGVLGPAVTGNFALNFIQFRPRERAPSSARFLETSDSIRALRHCHSRRRQ